MSPLLPDQTAALEQLWAITASSTDASRERDERLLRENGWNVESTVNQIFALRSDPSDGAADGGANDAGPSRSNSSTRLAPVITSAPAPRTMEKMEIDDSGVEITPRIGYGGGDKGNGRRRATSGAGAAGRGPGGLWGILGWPVRLVLGVVGGAWYFFIRTFIPLSFLPHLPAFLLPPGYSHYSPPNRLRAPDPTMATMSFLQDLSLLNLSPHSQTCPDFYIGPYREYLNTLRKEGKVGMIVLCCGEHEDDEEFKRSVLGDTELIRMLKEKDILAWGADIRTREGYQVAGTLLASTYPSVYFLSLLPASASRTGTTGSPKLQILTTLAGPPSTTTSSAAIMQLITNSILPRTSAFLARLKRERLTLEEARHLREEQDRAFRDAEKRDREKSRVAKEKEAALRVKADREKREAEEEERAVENRKLWRRYARKHLLPPPATGPGALRVAIRTPLNADRNIRHFAPSGSTEALFIYAETLLIPADQAPEDDPDTPPGDFTPPEDFRLVTTFPRLSVERTSVGGKEVWETVKKHGGALIAEKIEGSEWGEAERRTIRSQTGDDEESDEEVVE